MSAYDYDIRGRGDRPSKSEKPVKSQVFSCPTEWCEREGNAYRTRQEPENNGSPIPTHVPVPPESGDRDGSDDPLSARIPS